MEHPHPQIDSSYIPTSAHFSPAWLLSSTPHTSVPYNDTDSANNSNSFTKVAFTSLTVDLRPLSQSLSIYYNMLYIVTYSIHV